MERAIQAAGQDGWLRKDGQLGFILSDRFLNVDYGSKLREQLPKELRVDLLIDFRDTRVFEGALNYPAILIGHRASDASGELEAARVFSSETPLSELLEQFQELRKKLGDNGVQRGSAIEVFGSPRSRLESQGWWLMPKEGS